MFGKELSARAKERVVHDATEDARAAGTVEEEMTRRGGGHFVPSLGKRFCVRQELIKEGRRVVVSEEVEQ